MIRTEEELFKRVILKLKEALAEGEMHVFTDNTDMNSIMSVVDDNLKIYSSNKKSKAWKWLRRLSQRIAVYGGVLDVLVQHHPEYVALAWGTFKLLFMGVLSHEQLVQQLAKAYYRILHVLPEAEQDYLLNPNETMGALMTELHIKIIEFSGRAVRWYTDSKLKRTISCLVQPYSLRFKDIVDSISEIVTNIERLSSNLSRRELRQVRLEQQKVHIEVQKTNIETRDIALQVKKMLEESQILQCTATLDIINKRVYEIQVSQAISFTSSTPLMDPERCLEHVRVRRNQRYTRQSSDTNFMADSSQLQNWGNGVTSTQLLVHGNFESRHATRDFAVNVIELVQGANVPIIWALNIGDQEGDIYTPSDILKYLISQILQQNSHLLDERSAALSPIRFQNARTLRSWMDLLVSVLQGVPQVFLVLDLEVVAKCLTSETIAWQDLFQELFSRLADMNSQTRVKVAFLSTKSSHRTGLGNFDERNILRVPSNRNGAVKKPSWKESKGSRHRSAKNRRERLAKTILG